MALFRQKLHTRKKCPELPIWNVARFKKKKTVQKVLSPPQSKITVKKHSEHNELPHWIKVLPRKKLLFLTNKLNPWSYDQGNSESVTKYPKMGQSRIVQMLPRLEVFGCEATKDAKHNS